MKLHDIPELKWMVLSVFITTLIIKIYLAPTDILGLGIAGAALVVIVISLVLTLTDKTHAKIYWDENRGLAAILRPWTVEVSSGRLLASVPIGIDLSHSGKKVLQSMYSRFSNEEGGSIVFFITRPIGNETTKVGYLVRRRGLRLGNGIKTVDSLAKKLVTDTMILERSMRAAYPHLPVEEASFDDILKATTGGIETHAIA